MSSDPLSNLETPFQRVIRKNGRSKFKSKSNNLEITQPLTEHEKSKAIRRIHQAKEEISSSNLFKSITVALQKGLKILDKNSVTEIICLGLGKVV
ncbi:uncharacterized protein LOC123314708 isoform X3 [Coccinella septempunctata]|uniref:uncharacterized protein LOC123314708 isoform X3 n=1 Tax=Coccinella septempunctata TaxID=41139 RepID=UPI001D0665A7|nr:uncharacterized protein LOC123314708 isoform X3 [Coccinella septempunctata]